MTRPGGLGANLIGPETPILEAVAQMDAARRKLLLVVDDERRLLGALTDGDIRRGLMRRLPMEAPGREVMNPDPVALTVGSSDLTALARLEERGVSLAPVVDGLQTGRVVGERGRLGVGGGGRMADAVAHQARSRAVVVCPCAK